LECQKNNILHTFFCDSKEELEEKVEKYHKQEQEICLKMKELEFQKEKINKLQEQREISQQNKKKIEERLNALYSKTGLQNLNQLINARKVYEKKYQEKQEWQNKLLGKLGKERLEDWKRRLANLLREKEILVVRLQSGKVVFPLTAEELVAKEEEKKLCQEQLAELRKQVALYETKISFGQQQEGASLNQVRGEIGYWQKKLETRQERIAALELALQSLVEAIEQISKEVYPQLEKTIREVFPVITNSSYEDIRVKENLDLVVYLKEVNTSLSPQSLSLGALEQLYFTLRIALGKIISQGKSLPFFLDDVLVNFDGTRRMKAIQILAKLAEEQQIFLFTHDLQDALSLYGNLIELVPLSLERHLEVS